MTTDHRRLLDVVLDVDDDALATALVAAFAPHRTHRASASTLAIATRTVADLAAGVVVVAPRPDTLGDEADPDQLHDHLALSPRRWALAADVVGARVVLVSGDDVFGQVVDPDHRHDEFASPDPTDAVGRARRAGEAQVAAMSPGARDVVRVGATDDPAAVAALVRWTVSVATGGTWHLPGTTSARLDARHTRLVRDESSGGTSA